MARRHAKDWHSDMNAEIEEIERQLHELRNYLGPVELLLANMEAQLKKNRADLERKIAELELRFDGFLKQMESRDGALTGTSACPAQFGPDSAPPGANI